jgi:capsular polysaccharide biosynthesis protein
MATIRANGDRRPEEGAQIPSSGLSRGTTGTADELLRVLATRWQIVLVIALIVAIAAWMLAMLQTKRYRATNIAAVTPISDTLSPDDRIRGIQALDARTIIATAAALVATPVVTEEANAVPGGRGKPYVVRAVPMPDTNLLRIEVEGPDPARAAAIANAVPGILSAHTRSIFKYYGVNNVSSADSGELVFPRVGRTVAAGLIVGLVLGFAVAWALLKFGRPKLAAR